MALGTVLHDIPLALLFFLSGVVQVLGGLKLLPAPLLLPLLMGVLAVVGVAEIVNGRGIGWVCCAWAIVIATSFVVVARRGLE
jgi:hypothetical protein